MYKYNGLRRRKTYDEIVDYLLHKQETIKYPERTKLYPRGVLDDLGDGSMTTIKTSAKPDKETQTELRMSDKATQTSLNKRIQVDVEINPNEYYKKLFAYPDEEVISHSYWFKWRIKDKETQTSKLNFMNHEPIDLPSFTPPPSPKQSTSNPPLYVNIASDATDAAFAPTNFGLAWLGNYMSSQNASSPLNYSPPVSTPVASSATSSISVPSDNIADVIANMDLPDWSPSIPASRTESVNSSRPASRPITVASSRPISVNSSRPISVVSSRPISVASSPHYSPAASPSTLPYSLESPVVYEPDEPEPHK